MDWWLAIIVAVVGRKRLFAIPRDQHERGIQPQVWQRSRGSGVQESLQSSKMYEIYAPTSKKVSGRYYVLDRDDVVKLARRDLLETGWLRLGRSLCKPIDARVTQGNQVLQSGCVDGRHLFGYMVLGYIYKQN